MRPLKPCIIDWVKIGVLIRYVLQYRSLEVERSQTIKLCIYLCIYLFISCCCFLMILQVCCCFYKCCGVKKEATKLIKSCRFSLRWHEETLKYARVLRKPWKNWSQNSGPTEVNGNFAADCNWDEQDFTCCQSLIFYPILYFFPCCESYALFFSCFLTRSSVSSSSTMKTSLQAPQVGAVGMVTSCTGVQTSPLLSDRPTEHCFAPAVCSLAHSGAWLSLGGENPVLSLTSFIFLACRYVMW